MNTLTIRNKGKEIIIHAKDLGRWHSSFADNQITYTIDIEKLLEADNSVISRKIQINAAGIIALAMIAYNKYAMISLAANIFVVALTYACMNYKLLLKKFSKYTVEYCGNKQVNVYPRKNSNDLVLIKNADVLYLVSTNPHLRGHCKCRGDSANCKKCTICRKVRVQSVGRDFDDKYAQDKANQLRKVGMLCKNTYLSQCKINPLPPQRPEVIEEFTPMQLQFSIDGIEYVQCTPY